LKFFLPVLYSQNILQKNYPLFLERPKILKHGAFALKVVCAGGGWGIDPPMLQGKIHRPASSQGANAHDPELWKYRGLKKQSRHNIFPHHLSGMSFSKWAFQVGFSF